MCKNVCGQSDRFDTGRAVHLGSASFLFFRQFYFIGRGEILKISEKIIPAANIKLLTFSIKEIIIQIQQLNKYLII